MRLRMFGVLVLLWPLLIGGARSAHAQAPSDAELNALYARFNTLNQAGKYGEAIPVAERFAEAIRARTGESSADYATAVSNLAWLFKLTNRLAEAEPLMRRAVAIYDKAYGPDHPHLAAALNNLAQLLSDTNRLTEAEPLMRRVLAIYEKAYGPNHPNLATAHNNLGVLLRNTNRLAEAEPLYRRALAIDESAYGPNHPNVARDLNNLAQLLHVTDRFAEAEPLMRRVLAIYEKVYGSDHPDVIIAINNLAGLLRDTNRLVEAEPFMRRALAGAEAKYGSDHPDVARNLSNLANLLQATNRFAEAESLIRRALAIDEKAYGPNHPKVASRLNALAEVFRNKNRLAEAEPLILRALAIDEKAYGPNHPDVARDLYHLVHMRVEQNDWVGAAALCLRAKPILTGSGVSMETESRSQTKSLLAQFTRDLRNCARAHYRADRAANLNEGFVLAQWGLQSAAADAVTSMSARFAKGDARLAQLVREEQDLLSARVAAYRRLDAATGNADASARDAAHAEIVKIEAQLAAKQAALRHDFPEYAELANPQPLTLSEAQALLGEGQALAVFLDMGPMGRIPGETLGFVLTRREARWLSIPLGTEALRARVTALRCGLDSSNWRAGEKSRDICIKALNTEASESERPPFDAQLAHALYRDLFGGAEDLIADKSLLIVASGPLTQLPFQVLVTREPDKALPRLEAYKGAAWLGQSHAITVLPSVGSLKGLHAAKSSTAVAPFIAFGNPLLTGVKGTDQSAWAKQTCNTTSAPEDNRVTAIVGSVFSFFRGGAVDVDALRHAAPLPETADELCAVATGLGLLGPEVDKAVHLGGRATVTQVKALSAGGELARVRVVHFATHGLLAGETAQFAKYHAEPALLLTPPERASDDDNGLLTASEVAQLKLDADWVIMSACNTAAGEGENAEALSGLARAFFYAGARSLLVSHWPVNSGAAVKITTGAINEMKAHPTIGRAEALRRSNAALIAKGKGWDHPSIWAPFVLVGNGGQ